MSEAPEAPKEEKPSLTPEEKVARLLALARAVQSGKPIVSFVMSAVEMSEIVIDLHGSPSA